MKRWQDLRKGWWIWQWDRVVPRFGSAESLARLFVHWGIDHVCVKIADGTAAPYAHGRRFDAAAVEAFHRAGIFVWGWQYTYGRWPEEEARAFVRRGDQIGVDGYIIDAEAEYKNHTSRAAAYCAALKTQKPVALSSFYIPSYHSTFPWRTFMQRCDIIMPQVYWCSHSPAWAIFGQQGRHKGAWRENIAFGKPVWFTFPTDPELGGSLQKLSEGHAIAERIGAPVNYWLLDKSSVAQREMIASWRREPRPKEREIEVVYLPDRKLIPCRAKIEEGVTRCDLRALAESLGFTVTDKLSEEHRIYISRPGEPKQ